MVSPSTSQARRAALGLVMLAYIAFISLGLPDGLLGVAWPSIRADFNLPLDALGGLIFSTMLGYLVSSFFSGRILSRLGVGNLLAASCAATGFCLLGYTLSPAWWVMVALGLVAGLGAGAIDAGLNTYIAANHGETLMQWLHASFGVGVTLGPLIMTGALNLFGAWRVGYWAVGPAQLLLAACFALTAARWKSQQKPPAEGETHLMDYKTSLWSTLKQVGAWLSILLFFVYTGIELTLGYWVYSLLTEARGMVPGVAGLVTGSYWATFTVGRVLAGIFTRRIPSHKLLTGAMLLALVGAVLLWWNPAEWVSLAGVALVGFAIAPIFPGLVSGTQGRVSAAHTANTIGMQISAAGLGIAALPSLAGALAQRTSLEIIPPYMAAMIVLLFILFTFSNGRKTA